MEKNDYKDFQKLIQYKFKNIRHLETAFTHTSYVNELRSKKESYERYEFLGDAILEFIVSKWLFSEYPDKSEGELTKLRASLVCEYTLSQITKEYDFGKYLYLSKGEKMNGGMNRPSILCDLFESVLGAIYLDGGLEPAEKYVEKYLLTDIEHKSTFYDAKTILQEYAQSKGLKLDYKLLSTTGPAHNMTYTAAALINGETKEQGTGQSKKMAEQVAAHKTLAMLNLTGETKFD